MQPEKLLKECIEFCRMAGAERIYATGHAMLEVYPLHTTVVKMQQLRQNLPQGEGALFPVTEETAEDWRNIYNEKMQSVPNAAFMTRDDMKKRLAGAYFVHNEGRLLGIGIATGNQIAVIAAIEPGAGEAILLTLCNALFSDTVEIEVANNNVPAMRLYERLGFQKVMELSRWYDVSE